MQTDTDNTEKKLERAVRAAAKKLAAASERRRLLPPGSSRARVTTANARWAIACEAHDRALAALAAYREATAAPRCADCDLAGLSLRESGLCGVCEDDRAVWPRGWTGQPAPRVQWTR